MKIRFPHSLAVGVMTAVLASAAIFCATDGTARACGRHAVIVHVVNSPRVLKSFRYQTCFSVERAKEYEGIADECEESFQAAEPLGGNAFSIEVPFSFVTTLHGLKTRYVQPTHLVAILCFSDNSKAVKIIPLPQCSGNAYNKLEVMP